MLHECGRPRSTCGLLGGTCGGGGGATSSSSSSFSISNLFPSYAPPTTSNSTGSSSGGEGEGLSSYVDCTLSLGTPSTRHAGAGPGFGGPGPAQPPSSLQWDVMGRPNKQQCCGGGGGSGGFSKGNGGDAPRRCANCDTTSTPLWRNGPRGPKSLCNACGIRYKKEERRAATSSAVPPPPPPPLQQQWGCYGAAAAASKGAVSIAMYGDDGADSWRLNAAAAAAQAPQFHVRDWPSLFQYN
ncbi:GATA transcription factor 19 [Ananas comosus]|nr:GATA transcription factor 19 [Ananas comosus]